MILGVIGQGYVGLNLSVSAATANIETIGYDVNAEVISKLNKYSTEIPGIQANDLEQLIKTSKFKPTSDAVELSKCEVIVIAVPTPLNESREPDLTYLENACDVIINNVKSPSLIINESTSFPGTLRNFIMKRISDKSNIEFEYASAPERVDPANTNWNIKNTPRLVSGITESATNKAFDFYSNFCDQVVKVSSPEVAEASKLFENTFRQVNIALVNELAQIAKAMDFSTHEVIKAASTKPFGFMPFFPSIGVGGHCIPIDPSYLTFAAKNLGLETKFINLADSINLKMPNYVADRIVKEFKVKERDLRIQIAGIAYKPDVSDMRESPILDFIEALRAKGADVIWHDPLVKTWSTEESTDLKTDIDLGIIATPHKEIDFNPWRNSSLKVIDLSANPQNFGWPKYL